MSFPTNEAEFSARFEKSKYTAAIL